MKEVRVNFVLPSSKQNQFHVIPDLPGFFGYVVAFQESQDLHEELHVHVIQPLQPVAHESLHWMPYSKANRKEFEFRIKFLLCTTIETMILIQTDQDPIR